MLFSHLQREVKVLQDQLRGVQQQLADLHSQVKCLTQICSPQNVQPRRLSYTNENLGLSIMDEGCIYENVIPISEKQHNLTYTIQKTVSNILMCSMSPFPPAPSDQSNLSSFDLSRGDSTESLQSVCISDISRIPAVGQGELDYSVTDIVAVLHPSPELCPPQNTPESAYNSYMEISEIPPCARRLFPESSTKVGADLFTGRDQEVHSSPEIFPKFSKVRRSLTMSSQPNPFTRSAKSKDSKQFLRSSTRRSLKISKKTKQEAVNDDKNEEVPATQIQPRTGRCHRKKERPPCIGKELNSRTPGQKRKHQDTTYQSLIHLNIEDEPSSPPIYASIKESSPSNMTTSSDTTGFIEEPLCAQPVTKKTKSSKRKSISRELRRFGKNIQRFGAKKLKLETLAVL